MDKKLRYGMLGGILGLLLGLFGGACLGMVIGGTFFGWLEFSNYPTLTGYELGTYIGAALGLLIAIPVGVLFALRLMKKSDKSRKISKTNNLG